MELVNVCENHDIANTNGFSAKKIGIFRTVQRYITNHCEAKKAIHFYMLPDYL